ncbi:hypothetical protein GCK72_003085 [Caenorhabditis remanei]|uniref:Uncharacterized protein n=1 Tax=Caenorhabditis remanei TaxID=31234 RepID=A0A6A5HU46_CAERE|nr:hypothetical protein GCK72_003085 [Caenorhabditis remanei]KAF1771259.1 hypothetical protein GCK72_003085 [Caenorhabditis remanei]
MAAANSLLSENQKRLDYLERKCQQVEFPSAGKAKLEHYYIFKDATLVFNLCRDCRNKSAAQEIRNSTETHQELDVIMSDAKQVATQQLLQQARRANRQLPTRECFFCTLTEHKEENCNIAKNPEDPGI